MKAGRELDILIAEKVLGLVPCEKWIIQSHYPPVYMSNECDHNNTEIQCYPKEFGPAEYSNSLGASFQIIEKLNQDGIFVDLHQKIEDDKVKGWLVIKHNVHNVNDIDKLSVILSKCYFAETLPLAICLFALETIQ